MNTTIFFLLCVIANVQTCGTQDPPHKPTLSLNRKDKIFVKGEIALLTCTAPSTSLGSIFRLYRRGRVHPMKTQIDTSGQSKVTFNLTDTVRTGTADFFCEYKIVVSGRAITSERSYAVMLTVVGLPRPNISVYSREVVQGDNVTFNCATAREISVISFYLYKHGGSSGSFFQPSTARNNSVTFTIGNIDFYMTGNYTCGYDAEENGRRLRSAPSDSVYLFVRAKSLRAWIPVLTVVSLVILFALGGIYCWNKGKFRGPGTMRSTAPRQDQTYDNIVPNVTGRVEIRATSPPERSTNDNVLYADLRIKPQQKRRKCQLETFPIQGEDGTVYAALKL